MSSHNFLPSASRRHPQQASETLPSHHVNRHHPQLSHPTSQTHYSLSHQLARESNSSPPPPLSSLIFAPDPLDTSNIPASSGSNELIVQHGPHVPNPTAQPTRGILSNRRQEEDRYEIVTASNIHQYHGIRCSICHDAIVVGHTLRIPQPCAHPFHAECLDQWEEGHQSNAGSCPNCTNGPPSRPVSSTRRRRSRSRSPARRSSFDNGDRIDTNSPRNPHGNNCWQRVQGDGDIWQTTQTEVFDSRGFINFDNRGAPPSIPPDYTRPGFRSPSPASNRDYPSRTFSSSPASSPSPRPKSSDANVSASPYPLPQRDSTTTTSTTSLSTRTSESSRRSSYSTHQSPMRVRQDLDLCVICQDGLPENNWDPLLTHASCGHRFHNTCLIEWEAYHGCCPLCRRPLRPPPPLPRRRSPSPIRTPPRRSSSTTVYIAPSTLSPSRSTWLDNRRPPPPPPPFIPGNTFNHTYKYFPPGHQRTIGDLFFGSRSKNCILDNDRSCWY